MARVNLSNIDPDCLRRNADKIRAVDPKAMLPMTEQDIEKNQDKTEKQLLTLCENWLRLNGYLRVTAHNAEYAVERDFNLRGWFQHSVNNKRNPLMPDLVVWEAMNTRPPLLIELKVANRYQPGQREMINMGFWHELRDFEAFVVMVREWEDEQNIGG